MSEVLVDTSAWVDFFRGEAQAVRRVDPLLADGRAAICGPIYAELLSGARTRAALQILRAKLRALIWIPEVEDVWERIAEARYSLARSGRQAATIDVMIALSASAGGHELLTRDRDFLHIGSLVPVDIVLF